MTIKLVVIDAEATIAEAARVMVKKRETQSDPIYKNWCSG